MGISTFLIGLVPNYASIGIAAPILLLSLRLLQGFAFGGEWGGAVLMSFEYAPRENRGFYASFPQMGIATGLCLATGVVALLSYLLTEQEFLDWGWRVAFLLSALLLIVGIFIRLSVLETPEFNQLKDTYQVAKVPLAEVVRDYPGNIVLGWCARLIDGITFAVYSLFIIPYAVNVLHVSRTFILSGITISALLLIVTIPAFAYWSDRVGRRRLYAWASLVSGFGAFPVFYAMQYSGSATVAVVALVIALGLMWAPIYGPQAALFCELFDTRVRYTGISLVYQIAAIFSVSITPAIATALLDAGNNTPWLVASYIAVAGIISAGSTLFMRRTF
jgi:MFS family permease